MKTLRCRPVVTGDFIQPWLCKEWGEAEFDEHFEMLKAAGIDTMILQWAGEVQKNGVSMIHHKSTVMANDEALKVEGYEEYPEMLGNLLASARRKGMKIFVGLPMIVNQEWWDCRFTDEAWQDVYCDLTAKFAREIYDAYCPEYLDVIAGFYWCQEMYSNKGGLEKYWARMLNKDLDALTAIDPDLPLLMSPFYSSMEDAPISRIAEQWQYLLRNCRFRKGDILCPQDSYGASKFDFRYVEEGLEAMKKACDDTGKVVFWVNCENFGKDETPGDISRFVAQLHLAAEYAEKIVTFSYSHYYNPKLTDPRNDEAYRKYIKNFTCWDE